MVKESVLALSTTWAAVRTHSGATSVPEARNPDLVVVPMNRPTLS